VSKAAEARKLLIEGMSVADVSRATGAHYSQVHGIMKKLKESNELTTEATRARGARTDAAPKAQQPRNVRAGSSSTNRGARQADRVAPAPAVGPAPDSLPAEWLIRPDDEDAGECAECGVPLVERSIAYNGRDYGRALVHTFRSRGVLPTPEQLKSVERHSARRKDEREVKAADAKLGKRRVTTPIKPMAQAPVVGPARRSTLKAKPRNV